jgi:hypothetical protein
MKEESMKTKTLCVRVALVLCVLSVLLFAAPMTSALALEVPKDEREARVSITLPVDAAIAGGEVEFSQTGGLRFLRFEPANAVRNPVNARVDDKTYVGFFAEGNEYRPVDGALLMGDLVFEYVGDEPERVTLSMIKLHTKVDTGTGVDTQVIRPNTVIPVSRVADDDGSGGDDGGDNPGGGDDGGNGDSGNDGGGGGGNPGGGGTGNTGGGTGNGGGTSASAGVGVGAGSAGVAAPGSGGGTGAPGNTIIPPSTSPTSPNGTTGNQGIDEDAAPLASSLENGQGLPGWLLPGMMVILLAALFLFLLLLWRGKRRQEAMTAWDFLEPFSDDHDSQNDEDSRDSQT